MPRSTSHPRWLALPFVLAAVAPMGGGCSTGPDANDDGGSPGPTSEGGAGGEASASEDAGGVAPEASAADASDAGQSEDASDAGQSGDAMDGAADAAAEDASDASDASIASDASDAAPDAPSDSGPICATKLQKVCGAKCVPVTSPATGCADPSCNPCNVPHATPGCSLGACSVLTCDTGYDDCNGKADDGCEVDVSANVLHCGACGKVCDTVCSHSTCLAPTASGHLPDSATTLCTNGTIVASCPAMDQPLAGQDGSFTANKPSYNVSGATVYDPVSGLMWEHAVDPGTYTQAQAAARCDALNASKLAGYDDWRMPTAFELLTLADTGRTAGLTALTGQPQNTGHWSSTPSQYAGGAFVALGTNYNNMVAYAPATAWPSSSLCVRGAKPAAAAFAVSKSGNLVTDPRTSLVWQRAMAPSTYTWAQALAYCNTLTVDGIGGFRLPSYKELWSTLDTSKSNPAIDTAIFTGTPTGSMWTSTPVATIPSHAMVVETGTGRAYNFEQAETSTLAIRCVSGG